MPLGGAIPPPPPAATSPASSADSVGKQDLDSFGDPAPWAEPAWYNTLSSPYYNDSHKRLRQAIREYVDREILPYEEEWEEEGQVPKEVRMSNSTGSHCILTDAHLQESLKFVKAGLVLQEFPRKYRERAGVDFMGDVAQEGSQTPSLSPASTD